MVKGEKFHALCNEVSKPNKITSLTSLSKGLWLGLLLLPIKWSVS